MKRWIFNTLYFAIGLFAIYIIGTIGVANHSRTFQSDYEKAICHLTLWAVPLSITIAAAIAGFLLKRFTPIAPWPILQLIFLVAVPIFIFTPVGEHLTSWKHGGDIAIIVIFALSVSSLASCARNMIIGLYDKRFGRASANFLVGLCAAFVVFAGTSLILFFE